MTQQSHSWASTYLEKVKTLKDVPQCSVPAPAQVTTAKTWNRLLPVGVAPVSMLAQDSTVTSGGLDGLIIPQEAKSRQSSI